MGERQEGRLIRSSPVACVGDSLLLSVVEVATSRCIGLHIWITARPAEGKLKVVWIHHLGLVAGLTEVADVVNVLTFVGEVCGFCTQTDKKKVLKNTK